MLKHYSGLIYFKVIAELRAEVSRGYLGVFWWIAEPLIHMSVFYVVFGYLLNRGGPGYVTVLLTGLVVWRWFDASLRGGMNAILSNRNLMQQVYVPKLLFPLTTTLIATFKFLIVFALLVTFLLIYGIRPTWAWLTLPLLLGVQFLLVVAGSAVTAILVPLMPDTRVIINNLMTLMLFISGVFYTMNDLPEQTRSLFLLNPMASMIDAYRSVLIEGAWPNWLAVAGVAVFGILALAAALRVYRHFDLKLPKLAF